MTDRRLLCQVQAKGWVSFDHGTTTAIQALSETGGVVLEYPDTAPVRLSGPVTSQIMVIVVWALYGEEGLRQHPAMSAVRSVAPFPDVTGTAHPEPRDSKAVTASAAAPADGTVEQPSTDHWRTGASQLDLLAFVAAHELVLAKHAAQLLAVSESTAAEQLQRLVEQDLVARVRFSVHSPTAYRITQRGADQVGSALPPQRPLDLAAYRHAFAAQES